MEDKGDSESNITEEQFKEVVQKFKNRNKRNNDFLTKAG